MDVVKLRIDQFTDDMFYEFCRANDDVRIERDASGNIVIMAPTGFDTGEKNSRLTTLLFLWNEKQLLGKVGDSSTGYRLPNGAVRSPDASWISNERFSQCTEKEQKKILPACPDFVVELRSHSDNIDSLKNKMLEYIENGTRLAWLIDPLDENVFIYRSNGTISLVDSFTSTLSGEDVLPGFELPLHYFA